MSPQRSRDLLQHISPSGVQVQADGSLAGKPAESGTDTPLIPLISNRTADEVTPLEFNSNRCRRASAAP